MSRKWEEYNNIKKQALLRDDYRCRFCKFQGNLTPHHILFRSRGGKDTLENIVTLCIACHEGLHKGKLKIVGTDANGMLAFVKLDKNWRPQ